MPCLCHERMCLKMRLLLYLSYTYVSVVALFQAKKSIITTLFQGKNKTIVRHHQIFRDIFIHVSVGLLPILLSAGLCIKNVFSKEQKCIEDDRVKKVSLMRKET